MPLKDGALGRPRGASFLAIGIALSVEAFDRARIAPAVSTAFIAGALGLMTGAQHQTILAILAPIAGQAVVAAIDVMVYRTQGLLATSVRAIRVASGATTVARWLSARLSSSG